MPEKQQQKHVLHRRRIFRVLPKCMNGKCSTVPGAISATTHKMYSCISFENVMAGSLSSQDPAFVLFIIIFLLYFKPTLTYECNKLMPKWIWMLAAPSLQQCSRYVQQQPEHISSQAVCVCLLCTLFFFEPKHIPLQIRIILMGEM